MTCFWDALIHKLPKESISLLGLIHKPNPKLLCHTLVKQKKLISDTILWQGKTLSLQERREHLLAIKDDPCQVNRGHLTSSCDSFLLLICQLCKINIIHHGVSGTYHYTNPLAQKKIHLYSNYGHMW